MILLLSFERIHLNYLGIMHVLMLDAVIIYKTLDRNQPIMRIPIKTQHHYT